MKAKIEVIIRDEQGNVIRKMEPQAMELGSQRLHEIEGAVEAWRHKALPAIEAELLAAAQSHFAQQTKKLSTQAKRTHSSQAQDPTRSV